jgi:NAD(P)-dependent dehydrogenase (short-subunit alcohol dehydrogenase family)
MKDFAGKVAVITGAGGGFGREFARAAAALGMHLVLADIEKDVLDTVADELRESGARIIELRVDVSKAADMERLRDAAYEHFGAAHLLFNNAGVGAGGFLWESTVADWEWVLGVNLWSVIHGIRLFVPKMLAQGDECHIVNTASVAGLLSAQMMGVYNVSKHAVVTLSETLFHDLRTAGANIGVTVLCPAFVATGIAASERNRPGDLRNAEQTESQKRAAAAMAKAVSSGRITAADVAAKTFDAIKKNQFYCLTHPNIMGAVEMRMQDILARRNPTDPFTLKPDVKPG